MPAKMVPIITHPRPDAETDAWEPCRRWPSATAWRIPIVVRGGAWPFLYEIIDDGGLTGLTITETLPADWLTNGLQDYGVLTCASPAVGTYEITVRVTDQQLNSPADCTFTLEVIDRENTTYFVWVDAATGSNSNDGSFTSPKLNHVGWYGTSLADATHAGKQAHFMDGTYLQTDIAEGPTATQNRITSDKPLVLNAVGTAVVFQGNGRYWTYLDAGGPGAVIGINFTDPQTAESDGVLVGRRQFLRIQDGLCEERFLAFRCNFNGANPTAYSSNSSCIMFAGSGGDVSHYGAVIQCVFDECEQMDTVLTYTVADFVVEGCQVVNGNFDGQGIFFKGEVHTNLTVRANRGLNNKGPLIFLSAFTAASNPFGGFKDNLEVCWNNMYCPSDGDAYGAVGFGQGEGSEFTGDIWVYRNNIRSNYILNAMGGPGPLIFEENAIECHADYVSTGGLWIYSGNSIDAEFNGSASTTPPGSNLIASSGVLDGTTNLLTGGNRTTYLGLLGCEVA